MRQAQRGAWRRRVGRNRAKPCVRTTRILYRSSDTLAVTLTTYARNDIGASYLYEREMPQKYFHRPNYGHIFSTAVITVPPYEYCISGSFAVVFSVLLCNCLLLQETYKETQWHKER